VESPTLLFWASMGWVRPSAFRFMAICWPIEDKGNMNLVYKVNTLYGRKKPSILG
jgi:hypothetical protein